MPENQRALFNQDINNEQVVNDIIHFASTKEISLKIFNENITGSTVVNNVTISLGKSFEFQLLIEKEKELTEELSGKPESDIAGRLALSSKISHQKQVIKEYVRDILTLAEQFNRLDVNTERLRRAREYFDKGEFNEARALLNGDEEAIQSEEEQLWAEREKYLKEIESKLKEKADERLIQALLNQSDYANPSWFADTRQNFERSIKSDANKSNVFQYARFLQRHNQFAEAGKYYSRFLDDFYREISGDERATVLNNLAVLHETENRFDAALKDYEEALRIYRALNGEADAYLPDVALTLNNLAGLRWKLYEYEKASNEFEEALRIYRALNETDPNTYLPYVSGILHNLAALHAELGNYEDALKEYAEALRIKRALAETGADNYLASVALTLNNLADLRKDLNQPREALKEYEEALNIRRALAAANPHTYQSDVAVSLNNLAVLHSAGNKPAEAQAEFAEALRIYRSLAEVNPDAYLPYVGSTLNNFASFHAYRNEFEEALQKFEESTGIYRRLIAADYQTYFPQYAMNLGNLAVFYQVKNPQREKSVACAAEALSILMPHTENIPSTQESFTRALNVLRNWNLSNEEIRRLIAEKQSANRSSEK